LDYKHYKPWLRDDFSYRCVYCLCRETWFPDGQAYFGGDHLSPRTLAPERVTTYDDLVYACCVCNAWKQDFPGALDFGTVTIANHLQAQPDGTIRALTQWGEALIDACALNRPDLVAFRRDLQTLLDILVRRRGEEAKRLRKRCLGFPEDLPDLASLRPPGGNSRPEGIATSAFERRRRQELPDGY
jgi:hypothetical protein